MKANGGYFPFPNEVIDKLLPMLTGAEFKVLSVIMRQTIGWKKQWDRIAVSQFRKKGGMSKAGVVVSLDVLTQNKLILCEKVKEEGKLPENWYALFGETNESDRLVRSPDQYDKQTGTLIMLELVRSIDQLDDKLVRSPATQQTSPKKQTKQKTKQPDPFSPSADDADSERPEADQFISLLMLRFKLPTMPAYGMVNNMIHKYGMESCIAAMESSKPTSNTWSGILAYISKVAANISAQSRGISGEKLDKIERAYRELYDEVTEYREYFDANQDKLNAKKRKESARWLDWNESQLAMMRHTISENGGSLEVRR